MLINRFDSMSSIINNKIQQEFVLSTKNEPVYAIGDVHGCGDEFLELVENILKVSPNAQIYQLGDLIDRGPDLLKVFKICEDYNIKTIMGNHEYNFWLEVCSNKECRSSARRETHEKFNGLKAKHRDFIIEKISESKNFIRVSTENRNHSSSYYLLSHAPITKSRFDDNASVLNFCITSENDSIHDRFYGNIHGHTHWTYKSIEEQLLKKNLEEMCYNINLDSGAVYGGALTALNLFDKSFIQVKSKEVYFKE